MPPPLVLTTSGQFSNLPSVTTPAPTGPSKASEWATGIGTAGLVVGAVASAVGFPLVGAIVVGSSLVGAAVTYWRERPPPPGGLTGAGSGLATVTRPPVAFSAPMRLAADVNPYTEMQDEQAAADAAAAQAQYNAQAALSAVEKLAENLQGQTAWLAALAGKPPATGDPGPIGDYLNQTGYNAYVLYPELGWFANNSPPDAHPETMWRAKYDLSPGNHVEWWSNNDGSWGYNHTWGGFDVGRTIGDITSDPLGTFVQAVKTFTTEFQAIGADVLNNPIVKAIPWQYIADYTEAFLSNVPGLGTAAADVIATCEVYVSLAVTVVEGGNPEAQALLAAYDYLMASTPDAAALDPYTRPPVQTLIQWATTGETPTTAAINELVGTVPDWGGVTPNPRAVIGGFLVWLAKQLGFPVS